MITFAPMLGQHEWKWMQARTHVIACEDTVGIVAYDDNQNIVACCVADSFTVNGCNAHLAVDNPFALKAGFLNEIARYLFIENDRSRIFVLVASNNHKSLKFCQHIGFIEKNRIEDAIADGVDYVVMRMEREDCPWLEEIRSAA